MGAAVQRILRHADPRITMDVYGHLLPGYLKEEIDRLKLGLTPPETAPEPVAEPARAAANADGLAASLLQDPKSTPAVVQNSTIGT